MEDVGLTKEGLEESVRLPIYMVDFYRKSLSEIVRLLKENNKPVKRVAWNSTLMAVSNIAEKGLLFVFSILIARKFGARSCGDFFTAFVFVNIVFVFIDFGLVRIVTREVAIDHHSAGKYCGNMLGIRIASVIFAMLAIVLILPVCNFSYEVNTSVFILSAYAVLLYLSHPFVAVFRAVEKMRLISYMIIADRLTTLILSFALILGGFDLLYVETSFLLGGLIRILIGTVSYIKIIGPVRFMFDVIFWKRLLKESYLIGLFITLLLLYFRVDTLLLSFLGYGSSEIGLYNAAYNIFVVMSLPAMSFSMATFPVFSRFYCENGNHRRQYEIVSLVLIIIVGVTVAAIIYVLAEPIILLLYGSEFQEATGILKMLTVGSLFTSINWFMHSLFTAASLVKELVIIVLGATIFNAVLNIALIPSMASKGAAIATCFTEFVAVLSFLFFFYKTVSVRSVAGERVDI